jgi:hypothetical protein
MLLTVCTALTVLLASAQSPCTPPPDHSLPDYSEHCQPPPEGPPVDNRVPPVDPYCEIHPQLPPPPTHLTAQEPLTYEISTAGSMVIVNFKGMQATAFRMSLTSDQDAIVLDGQVEIKSHTQTIHITAEHVKIRLSNGSIEVGAPQPQPQQPTTPPAPPVVPVTPACTTGGTSLVPLKLGIQRH